MSGKSLAELSDVMSDIDFAMLATHTEGGRIAGRPMSNNGDVAYEGTSYFFTWERSRTVEDIERDPKVALFFTGSRGLLGRPPIFIAVEGEAALLRDRASFEAHWVEDLSAWFKQGIDTPFLVLIKVQAKRITYWDGEEVGEVVP